MTDQPPQQSASAGSEEILLRLIQARSEAALAELYDTRGRLVYSLALSIVGNEHDAEEITQETFLKIWDKAATFDLVRGSALAWITTITRRLAIDRTRSKHYRATARNVSTEAARESGAGDVEGAASGDTSALAEAREVADALALLNDQHREVIQMSYFDGLSHAKIAEALGAPLGTVKSRIREAVRQLRKHLNVEAT